MDEFSDKMFRFFRTLYMFIGINMLPAAQQDLNILLREE